MGLRKRQRNLIVTAVEEAGFSPEEFEWQDGADESSIRHRATGASFFCGGGAGAYRIRRFTSDDPVEERSQLTQDGLMQQVKYWLSDVKWDIETPDLWAQVQRESEFLGAVTDEGTDNTPFTPAEQEKIAERLGELGDYVQGLYSLSASQMQLLEEKLDYLTAASSRLGRKDWRLLAIGAMTNFILAAGLPPGATGAVFQTLVGSITQILGHGPLGLPGG